MTSRSVVETRFVHRIADKRKHTPAYKIFYYMFDVYIPYAYHLSQNYVDVLGTPVSGDEAYDKGLAKQMVGGRFTVAQLAELLDEGAQIRLHQPTDALVIYEMIFQHLNNWSDRIRGVTSLDILEVPEDDLLKLTRLGDDLYKHAARFITGAIRPTTGLAARMADMRSAGRKAPVKKNPDQKPERPVLRNHGEFTKTIMYGAGDSYGNGRTPWS